MISQTFTCMSVLTFEIKGNADTDNNIHAYFFRGFSSGE